MKSRTAKSGYMRMQLYDNRSKVKTKFNYMDEKIIIPILLFLAAGYSAYRASKAIKSGSTRQLPGGGTEQSDQNVGWFQTGAGWFAAIFFGAAIIVTIIMISER